MTVASSSDLCGELKFVMTNIPDNQLPLVREEYYLLAKKKSKTAIPIKYNSHMAYLHKETRGFSKYGFTNKDMQSIVKLLVFEFFGYKCTNVNSLLLQFDSWTPNDDEAPPKSFGPPIFKIITTQGDYREKRKFRLIDICNFIDGRFSGRISQILNQPISAIYNKIYPIFYALQHLADDSAFRNHIAPTVYDFSVTRSFLQFIETLEDFESRFAHTKHDVNGQRNHYVKQ